MTGNTQLFPLKKTFYMKVFFTPALLVNAFSLYYKALSSFSHLRQTDTVIPQTYFSLTILYVLEHKKKIK